MPDAHSRPIVCYVTDRKTLSSPDPLPELRERITSAISAGVDWIQIREKDLSTRELLELAGASVANTQKIPEKSATHILVNDRLDVALAAGAAGVHLGRKSAPAKEVEIWCRNGNAPADFLIGVSCHNLEEVREAEIAGASYVFFGPVFDTPSKRAFGTPLGVAELAKVCAPFKIPVIAIGGVDESNAGKCIRAGAAGIAAIRLFQAANQNVESLKEKAAALHRIR